MDLVRRTLERYIDLSDAEWEQLLPHWQQAAFAKGEHLTRIGEVEDRFGIVATGVQRLYHEYDGVEHCVGFSYDGSWTGVYDSFVTGRPSRFALQAVTDTTVHFIRKAAMEEAYRTVPVMERFGRLILEELLVGRATREIEQIAMSAEDRYRRLVERSPHLLQLVAQKDIASYLRMTPETFSRLRARVRS